MVHLKENKVLIHTCCAICSGYPLTLLKELGFEPVTYFFNPNIYPEKEYQKRLEAQKTLCNSLDCELIIEGYEPQVYFDTVKGFEDYPEGSQRCSKCFELRLEKTAQKAKELGVGNFTTTLSISPHKNFEVIKTIGQNFSDCYKINFVDINFKKQDGFVKSNKIARDLNLYRQNYCGCKFSIKGEM